MHELALTESLVDRVADAHGRPPGHAVHVRVGLLSGVVPEAMEFCFDVVTAGGPLDGATLVVERVPGRIACRALRGGVARPTATCCRSAGCGSADVEVVAGRELDADPRRAGPGGPHVPDLWLRRRRGARLPPRGAPPP